MCKILCKPVVNVAFNETMSFETQRMSSETSGSWQSRSLTWNSGHMDTRTALWRRVISDTEQQIYFNIRELKQTDAAAVNQQISIQKDSRPSELTRPLTSFTL